MRISHLEMERRINDQMSTLTDEEVLGSSAFAAYLTDMAEVPLSRVRRKARVKTVWDPSGKEGTFTDNEFIQINCASASAQSLPTRRLRVLFLIGDDGHECGHILYSNFALLNNTMRRMQLGHAPRNPKELTIEEQGFLEEYKDYLMNTETPAQDVVLEMYKFLWNLLEDIYVNERMCDAFPGVFAAGIRLSDAHFLDMVPSVQQQIDDGKPNITIAFNLLFQYALSGDINNLTSYTGELLDRVYDCLSIVDDSLFDDDPKTRLRAAHHLAVKLWPYIKEQADKATERKNKGQSRQEATEAAVKEASSGMVGVTAIPNLKGKGAADSSGANAPSSGKYVPDFNAINEERNKAQQVIAQETARIALSKTDTIMEGNGGSFTYDPDYAGSGYDKASQDIFRLMSSMATERANTQIEEELSAELQAEADKIRYGNAHKGIDVVVNRITSVSGDMMNDYNAVAPALHLIAQKTQDELELQGTVAHVRTLDCKGTKIWPSAAYRRDMKMFRRKAPYQQKQSVSIAFLGDESGSMSGNDRITRVRATCIVVQKLCVDMKIPHIIYGHSTNGAKVMLYSYSEFDSVDHNDCYRIMDMSARGSNRDGAALRFVAERLLTRPEKYKILILASDGQPAHTGYSGTAAEADLRGIKEEYEKKGIRIFAAAIGEDKPNIERIYGNGFLDVTNLDTFPQNLARMIAQYTKR